MTIDDLMIVFGCKSKHILRNKQIFCHFFTQKSNKKPIFNRKTGPASSRDASPVWFVSPPELGGVPVRAGWSEQPLFLRLNRCRHRHYHLPAARARS